MSAKVKETAEYHSLQEKIEMHLNTGSKDRFRRISIGLDRKSGSEDRKDELDEIIKQSVEQVEETAALSERIAKKVAETEQIANESLNTLNTQGETINRISGRMDDLGDKIGQANRDAQYLKSLTGSIFIPVSAPKFIDTSIVSKLQFASKAPKDSTGRPLATPRLSSITLGTTKGPSGAQNRKDDNEEPPAIKLDESASAEDHARFQQAQEAIDQNLGVVSKGIGHLKQAALTMGNELGRQNEVISSINDKADDNQDGLAKLNKNVQSMMKQKKVVKGFEK